jgi:Secretion system C-terminal sorting domain
MRWLKCSATTCSKLYLFILSLSFLTCNIAHAQDFCSWPATAMKQKKITGLNIPGTNNIHGYLEKLPDDYNATKKYPVFIFIHGVNETGPGTVESLCDLVFEWSWTPSTIAERTSDPVFPASVLDKNGQAQKFILISPQLVGYGDANTTMNSFITFLLNRYKGADPARVYLSGISAGANYINDYASASQANAERIAAIIPVAPCGAGSLSAQGAHNIAAANLPFWATQCDQDSQCGGFTARDQADLINSQNPAPTVPAWSTVLPVAGYPCPQNVHEIWGTIYNQSFKQTINSRNVNIYEWAVQYSRNAALPVALEDYTVNLRDEKVQVQWTTSSEINNARFNIERSADGRQFTEIATVPAVGNTTGKTYQWIDDRPLTNLSYYRLSQTDLDGRKEYFAVKKVMNRSLSDRTLIVAPNPFTTELTAFINVAQAQQVTISLTDINGRILKTVYGKYAQGAAEININTNDLSKGVYLLKIKGEDFMQTQKVIKQ